MTPVLASIAVRYYLFDKMPISYSSAAYAVSGVAILLILVSISEKFYSKKEDVSQPKTGLASFISVATAVISAIGVAIGLLIAVASFINLFLILGDEIDSWTALLSSLSAVIIYSMLIFRTILPRKSRLGRQVSQGALMGLSLLILIMGMAGPLYREFLLRHDRLIESGLAEVQYAIERYTTSNRKLPASLNDIRHFVVNSPQGTRVIDQNLISYDPNTKPQQDGDLVFYQLCTTYEFDGRDYNPASSTADEKSQKDDSSLKDSGYSSYVDYRDHPKGKICYQ